MRGWVFLLFAILLEVAGTTCMKFSDGFSRIIPSIFIFVFYSGSFAFFTVAIKNIDISIAYAIWSGVGTAIISVIGFMWFKEPVSAIKIVSIAAIIAGVVGLRLSGVES